VCSSASATRRIHRDSWSGLSRPPLDSDGRWIKVDYICYGPFLLVEQFSVLCATAFSGIRKCILSGKKGRSRTKQNFGQCKSTRSFWWMNRTNAGTIVDGWAQVGRSDCSCDTDIFRLESLHFLLPKHVNQSPKLQIVITLSALYTQFKIVHELRHPLRIELPIYLAEGCFYNPRCLQYR
jgi:hypothetical protein